MLRRFSLSLTLLAAAMTLTGCGSNDGYRFPVYPTAGTVMYKGQPLKKAFVRFHPTDPAALKIPDGQKGLPLSLTTETEKDGAFALSTYLAGDGIPAGDY